ncbi:MAG: pyridoxal phosphate-dependent aminotransferase [Candidatus Brocadiia bacterium]
MGFEHLIAGRMSEIDSSGIRRVFDLAKNISNPVNLSIGQPDFEVPGPVKNAAVEAINSNQNRYTVTQGIQELREGVLETEKERTGIEHEGVLITSGVSGGLLLALMALVNPGDEVVIPDPYFVMYKHLCRLLGGEPLFVDTYPDFQLTVERLKDAGAGRAKLLLLNSPNNPTGQILPENELRRIASWSEENEVLILSDEIYSDFVYDGDCVSVASFAQNVLLLSGFSKSSGMTGWRLGYAIGPEEIIGEMTKLQQFSFVCAPSIAQHAGIIALDIDIEPYIEAYRRKRDLTYEGLKKKFDLPEPQGAFYAFVRAPDGDGDAFVEKAIEHSCLVIPGSVFSESGTHFRLSFAAPDETIEKGTKLLCSLV